MMRSDRRFAVFIISYGRCDRVITIHTLRNQGYTGDIIVLTEKSQLELYQATMQGLDKVTVEAYD